MANNPAADAAAMRPLIIGVAALFTIFIGLFAFTVLAVLDGAGRPKTATLALNTTLCPPPQPGQVLVVTLPAPNAQGDVTPSCTTLESQGAARAKLATKEAQ